MSTTVTYKGETLTTVSNDTAVLETGGTWLEDDLTLTDVTSGGTMQSKSNIDPTTSSQTITPDTGYDGLSSVQINAMPTGTAGTPTATKGTVSNHSIAVTPSVTNTTGYITGSTINGTAVTVSASELDSGSKSITANGNSQDVVGYASVDVAVPNSYSASDEGKVVDNGALVSQTSDTVTANDTYDTTLINSLTVNVSGGAKTNIDIGIQNTPIPSILNMFYALESGTAKTGEFTPATALPNTSTALFDTEMQTVHGLFIADETQSTLNTGTSPENLLFGIAFNPVSENVEQNTVNSDYAMQRPTVRLYQNKSNYGSTLVNRGQWDLTNGIFNYTAPFNKVDAYCAFSSGHTYRWVAW